MYGKLRRSFCETYVKYWRSSDHVMRCESCLGVLRHPGQATIVWRLFTAPVSGIRCELRLGEGLERLKTTQD